MCVRACVCVCVQWMQKTNRELDLWLFRKMIPTPINLPSKLSQEFQRPLNKGHSFFLVGI